MENFNELINSEKPTLVDMYTTWCTPCRMMSPIIDQLKTDMNETLNVVKIDVDLYKDIAIKYNVRSVPTLILFKNGEPVWRHSGVLPITTLKEEINQFI